MKKKLLLLPLMMLILSSCSLFGGPRFNPADSDPTSTDSVSSDPSDTGSISSHPSEPDDLPEYTVTFDLSYEGATDAPHPQSVKKYGLVSKPNDPKRDDFTFLYWHEGMYGTIAWDFDNTGVTKDMTLYASWEYNYVNPEPTPKTFYVRAPEYWLEDSYVVSLYAWIEEADETEIFNSAWPGELMTHIDGQIYSYGVSEKYTHIIFARVTPTGDEPAEGAKAQTINLDITNLSNPDFDFYWINDDVRYGDNKCQGSWNVYPNEPDEIEPEPDPVAKTFYVRAPEYWLVDNHVVALYAWNQATEENNLAWPGDKMTHVEGQVYKYDVSGKFTHIIFARVTATGENPAEGAKAQTINLDITNLSNPDFDFYWINDDIRYGDNKCVGRWSVYPDEPEGYIPDPGTLYYVQIPIWWDFDGAVAGIHMWEGENVAAPWPGQIMNYVANRIYSFEIPDEYNNFLFARVNPNLSEWATAENEGYWGAKTIDLNKDEAGVHNLYTISETEAWGDPGCQGVWSTYEG